MQLEKDQAREKERMKRRHHRVQKMQAIDKFLQMNIGSKPWNPKYHDSPVKDPENRRHEKSLQFCEPLQKVYNFDAMIDSHQQKVVTECIQHLGILSEEGKSSENKKRIVF